jgi:transcription elongation factor Elf1
MRPTQGQEQHWDGFHIWDASKHNMRMKLDKKCPVCNAYLSFVEQEDGVYVLCGRCRMAVYTPTETAAEYVANFSELIKLMVEELANLAKRRVKQKRGN